MKCEGGDMKCEVCVSEGRVSRVFPGSCLSTAMYSAPYYDEAGAYHSHDPNERSQTFTCTNGHAWSVAGKRGCGVEGCTVKGYSRTVYTSPPGWHGPIAATMLGEG